MLSLHEIWQQYGGLSDKDTRHSYIEVYAELFAPYRDRPTHLLEIGMGGGDCLVAWSHYFHSGEVAGLDLWVGQDIGNIRKVQGDATSAEVWQREFANDQFDIIIDDASHVLGDQIATFGIYRQSMRPDGVYVIEDVGNMDNAAALQALGFEIIDRRHVKGTEDDILAVLRF